MGGIESEPSPPPDLPDELVDAIARLNDHQLVELTRYTEKLLNYRTRPISEMIHETVDEDRIVSIEEHDGYASVRRHDTGEGPPVLYRVTREQHPDGEITLHWTYIGPVADE